MGVLWASSGHRAWEALEYDGEALVEWGAFCLSLLYVSMLFVLDLAALFRHNEDYGLLHGMKMELQWVQILTFFATSDLELGGVFVGNLKLDRDSLSVIVNIKVDLFPNKWFRQVVEWAPVAQPTWRSITSCDLSVPVFVGMFTDVVLLLPDVVIGL
ncbi:hypothetical protein VTN00DRAFT_4744 [Thermoascus crustaceus]|uniref:uncharacterized protein n=1 Tax=Thermoascus crustaceus TaxID=5088 RepID=UPI003743F17F